MIKKESRLPQEQVLSSIKMELSGVGNGREITANHYHLSKVWSACKHKIKSVVIAALTVKKFVGGT